MKRKSVVTLLAILSALGFTIGAAACNGNPNGQEKPQQAVVSGFDVRESLEVNLGAVVELEQPVVTDAKGVLLDCWTYVTDEKGNYVVTTAGAFTADNAGVYTIVYVVRDSANNTYQQQTKVTVLGNAAAQDITLNVEYEQFISVGETVAINAICSDKDADLTYTVKRFSTSEAVTMDGNAFVPQEEGIYEVLVSANDGEATYKYNVFAEEALQKGEVERFTSAWEEKEKFVGGKRQDWQVVTSEESGLLDPYGRACNLAKYSTDRAYIPLYINIREDVKYYEQLAEEGYSYVSMWIYMEGEKPHITISDRDPNGGFYRRNGPDLYPGEWTEFRLDLVTGKTTWYRSFVQCYPYYNNQSHFYLQVDNSYEWNTWGGGDNITFYFTDIYAVKEAELLTVEGVETQKTVKDTIDFSTVFNADFDMTYVVSYRGEKFAIEGSEYTFLSNGEYVVEAIPSDFNLRGSTSVEFNVTDEHVLSADYVTKERTSVDSVTVNISELNAAFEEVNGVTPTIASYKVYYNGAELALTDNAFTAAKEGAYAVEVEGSYSENGTTYTTYQTVYIDVWSQATKYAVIDTENMRCIRAWDWDNTSTTATYEEATVGGKTGNFIKTTAKGQSLTFYGKPLFSKNYYQAMLEENEYAKVRMSLYFIPAVADKITNVKSVFTSTTNKTTWDSSYENQWRYFEMSMESFIEQYDDIVAKYTQFAEASWGDDTNGGKGCWLHMLGSQMGRTVYMDVKVGFEATDVNVALKSGTSFALKTQNDLRQMLDVILDENAGEVTAAQVYFNEEWVELTSCIIEPVWAGEYLFRLDVASLDGGTYKTVEQSFMIGDTAFTATADTDVHVLKSGEQFDIADLLTGSYTFEIETFKSRGGVLTKVDGLVDGTVIDSADLEVGAYFVEVYAVDGASDLSKILYYTFTLDYVGDYTTPVWIETPTSDNYKKIFSSYQYTSVQHLTGTSITTECPTGNSGTFLKYEGKSDNRKEAMSFAMKPLFSEVYYRELLKSAKTYSVKFDVYIENVDENCTRTEALYYYWKMSDGVFKFTTHGGKMSLNAWHTVEIPLETLMEGMNSGEVKFFGLYIPYGGYSTADLVRMWMGNIRLEEAPMVWTDELTSANMEKQFESYQYESFQYMTGMSVTSDVPTEKTGSFLKYTGSLTNTKEQMKVKSFAKYSKAYYQELLDSGKSYKVTFDVYVENGLEDCTRTEILYCYWNAAGDSFTTHGNKLALDTWHTIEINLSTLVNNWDKGAWLFGVQIPTGGYTTADIVNFYLGNIQLVEAENA